MTNPIITGYLDDPYLNQQYLVSNVLDHYGTQSQLVITDRRKALALQAQAIISGSRSVGVQSLINIVSYAGYAEATQTLLSMIKASSIGAQIKAVIESGNTPTGSEVEAILIKDHALGIQVKFIVSNRPYENGVQSLLVFPETLEFMGVQSQPTIIGSKPNASQSEAHINNNPSPYGAQSRVSIEDSRKPIGHQSGLIINGFDEFGVQSQAIMHKQQDHGIQSLLNLINKQKSTGIQFRLDKTFPHQKCEDKGYLAEDYLEGPYLAPAYCVSGPVEVELFLHKGPSSGVQARAIISAWTQVAEQIRINIVDALRSIGIQFNSLQAAKLGVQFTAVLYNTTNLRVMYTFPSRGTTGSNWTATSTDTGDFNENNLNTDIVEQRYQSAAGDTTISLVCDTQVVQGIAVDTAAFLNHNLTTSAAVALEGSNDNFATVGESIPLTVRAGEDLYYIATTYPTSYYRYWRLQISDSTNPDGQIKIGTALFGSAVILQGETFTDIVRKRKIHFSDKVKTEGYTAVSNDRALKKLVSVDFQKIAYGRGNFKNMEYIFDYARTSLKCLWIPDPKSPARFSVFGKLSQMPEESHLNMGTDADYVDFSIEVDESL